VAYTLTMPEVGETVTEGTIERWLKQPGDQVKKYEPIVEVNTDKVEVELPSPVTGTVKELLVQEGEVVAIGAALAVIDEVAGETPAENAPPAPPEERPSTAKAPAAPVPGRAPARATPRVRKLAEELGVDLATVEGSGPQGRIIEDDVRAAAGGAPQDAPARAVGEDEELAPLTSIRRTIAQRMSASVAGAPHAWMVMEADVTGLVELRAAQREAFREREGVDLTYLPFVAAATAASLREHPYLNASWSDDGIVLKKRVHLGIAVATEKGLLVPVVRDADSLGPTELARAIADVSERARDGKLKLEDVQGGTFTLDNTGWFGSVISMPIINLGQAAILAFEAVTKRPVVLDDDSIAVRSVVNLCLSFDHRILDGAQAGEFMRAVVSKLQAYGPETPLS
jgi:2-oxoisovalerate dehydrogenase E2 component (dihydrolipoyl transacylase)